MQGHITATTTAVSDMHVDGCGSVLIAQQVSKSLQVHLAPFSSVALGKLWPAYMKGICND